MVKSKIIIHIPSGLHLRPISALCNKAIEFQSNITIKFGDKRVNAKSVLGMLSAGIKYDDEIELVCDGPDEDEALRVLSALLSEGLREQFSKK